MENELFEEVKKEVTACGEAVGEVGKLRLIDLISRLLGLFLLIFTIVLLLSALFTFAFSLLTNGFALRRIRRLKLTDIS